FAGVVRAHRALQALPEAGRPRLIVGCELRLADGPCLVLLAADRAGYGRLSRLLTQARRSADKGRYHLTRAMLDATRADEAAAEALPGCLALLIPPEEFPPPGAAGDAAIALRSEARWLAKRFPGRSWIAHTPRLDGRDPARLHWILRIAQATGVPAVAAGGALMHEAARRPLADVMSALRLHCSVAEAGLALAPNAELRLHERATLARRHPPELLAETVAVAARCRFDLDELRYEYPAELVPADETPTRWLRRLVEGGLAWRYGKAGKERRAAAPATIAAAPPPAEDPAPPTVRAQIEHELALIAELGYEPYFLTVHDIVRFARERGILCQGRGSAANSVVCWALGITEVDPQLGIMLVERFISRERDEPPDIDVDFEHERREEVIQYLYRKYGRERAALAATVIRYRARSALRDVGRALGLDETQIERLTREHHWFDGRHILPERLAEAGLDPASPVTQRLVALTEELIGFPRHLSQHVGGFVIARGRLDELVPVENAAMSDRTVIQWDKDDLD
ncbi:MAG: error-prone DNA polymerase, partial [Proteobacteria bacterium]|nr:error-prone DNA polymerase [Pseudomonadota bacterium]